MKNSILICKTNTIQVNECRDGFWLHDFTQGMNLAMGAKTEREAFIESLEYYQNRLMKAEAQLGSFYRNISNFVQIVHDEHDIVAEINNEE